MADHRPTGTDTVVKVVLVFFISLLSFSIGTFVGKKYSDNQHRMATMEPIKNSKGMMHDEEMDDSHMSSSVSHDNSPKMKGEANHDSDNLGDDQAALIEEEMGSFDEDLSSNTVNKKEKVTNGENVKLSKVLAREIASKGTAKYTIQVASYSTQEEAVKKVNELKGLKLESFSTETTIKGHQWYRVNVGVFSTIKEAQTKKGQLADQAKINNAIIQKLHK